MAPLTIERLAAAGADLLQGLTTQLVYSLLLSLAVLMLLKLLRVRSAAVRAAAWSLVLLRLVLAPGWASPLSLRSMLEQGLASDQPAAHAEVEAAELSVAIQPPAATVYSQPGSTSLLWPLLSLLWAGGAVTMVMLFVVQVAAYRGCVRRAAAVADPKLLMLAERWRRIADIGRTVTIVSSDERLVPFTCGLLWPKIYLPAGVLGWSESAIEPIIAHEMAHIRRGDELRMFIANLIRAVYFFNPAAWLAVHQLNQTREELCDQAALGAGVITPRTFGHSLVAVLRLGLLGGATEPAPVAWGATKKGIEMRLKSVLSGRLVQPHPALLLAAWTVIALFVLPMAKAQIADDAAESPALPAAEQTLVQAGDGGGSAPADPAPDRIDTEPEELRRDENGVVYFRHGSDITEPKIISSAAPTYPPAAAKARISGAVILETLISTDGRVDEVKVIRGLPLGCTEEAVDAVRQWQLEPATRDGLPIPVWYVLAVRFNADETPPLTYNIEGRYTENLPFYEKHLKQLTEAASADGIRLTIAKVHELDMSVEGFAESEDLVEGIVANLRKSASFSEPETVYLVHRPDGVEFKLRCKVRQ